MSESFDVLILGGGVIGLTTAWYLAGQGARVGLVERGEVGRAASWAGAGIIPSALEASAVSPMDRLRALSVRLFPELSAALFRETGLSNGYVVCGGIELPDPERPDAELPTEEWHSPGVPVERWGRETIRATAPYLAPEIDHGVFLPTLAQVRNPWHLEALHQGCKRRGVEIHEGRDARLVVRGDRVAVEGIDADRILVAAGAWSAGLLAPLGVRLPIRPVRGQMLLYRTPDAWVRPVVMQGKRYLVPRADGRILVGSTEEEAGFDATTTSEGLAGLVAFAHRVMPSLAEVSLERSWAGLRPGSPEGVPFLGAVPGYDNLHVACGHFRAGIQLSAATGLVMAEHLLGREPSIALEGFGHLEHQPGEPV
jgi:glycine oxidase